MDSGDQENEGKYDSFGWGDRRFFFWVSNPNAGLGFLIFLEECVQRSKRTEMFLKKGKKKESCKQDMTMIRCSRIQKKKSTSSRKPL